MINSQNEKLFAVIDVGSNSVRGMLVDSNGKELYKHLITTRLIEGMSENKMLTQLAIENTVSGVKYFADYFKSQNCLNIDVFATEAVRGASNKDQFIQAVIKATDLKVDVLSGDTEGKIAVFGALGKNDGGIIDIGGGSSEVTIQKSGEIVYNYSLKLGAVRLFDMCNNDYDKLKNLVSNRVKEYNCNIKTNFKAVGGTATTIAQIAIKARLYSDKLVDGYILTRQKVGQIVDSLKGLSVDEIIEIYNVEPKRSQVIFGGAVLLLGIMEELEIDSLQISTADNLKGYMEMKNGI